MKKRLLLLPLFASLALTSCGDDGIIGTYKFQMGKDNGTKMGASITLTDEDVKFNNQLLGKKFTLLVDMDGFASSSESASSASSSAQSDGQAINDTSFYGYYKMGGTDIDGSAFPSNHVSLGTTMISDEVGIDLTIEEDLTELLIYAEIDKKTLNIYIPVSFTDLQYQLYWYGYRINTEDLSFSKVDYAYYSIKPTIGSHPTAKDIAVIKEHEAKVNEPNNPFVDYRDYHTLTMGLSK